MKLIIYILISFLFMACNSQNKSELKNILMTKEQFDVKKFEKNIVYYDKDTDENGKEILIKQKSSHFIYKLSSTC